MKHNILFKSLLPVLFLCYFFDLNAQLEPNVYRSINKTDSTSIHQLLLDNEYIVLTEFQESPPKFIKTLGGFYTIKDNALQVELEFNSNYEADSLKILPIPFTIEKGKLILTLDSKKEFAASQPSSQELDGKWLMAGRMVDNAEQRRDTTGPRKTMKFLNNGHFQWIAFHTETMAFSGTGGGVFTSKDGVYIENIEFFSRDASRVGAKLDFKYDLKSSDWHHMGKSSKGDPLHEIWAKRLP